MADARLDKLHEIVAHHLNRIRGAYTDPQRMRLTLLIRDPQSPDGSRDVLLTDDDLDEVRAAITRLETADV